MKNIFNKIKDTSLGTKIRALLLILTYINQVIALIGLVSFATNPIYQWITFGLTVLITALSYWYNNDWTGFAQLAGDILKMLKDGKITSDEITEFLNKHKKPTKEDAEE